MEFLSVVYLSSKQRKPSERKKRFCTRFCNHRSIIPIRSPIRKCFFSIPSTLYVYIARDLQSECVCSAQFRSILIRLNGTQILAHTRTIWPYRKRISFALISGYVVGCSGWRSVIVSSRAFCDAASLLLLMEVHAHLHNLNF